MQKIKFFEKFFESRVSRRIFVRTMVLGMAAALVPLAKIKNAFAKSTEPLEPRKNRIPALYQFDIGVVKGNDPSVITRKAVESIGGMNRFVKSGDTVVVKPNIGWDRSPEQAGNTNPYVVETLVRMAFEAGAKTVKVFDNTCSNAQRTYSNSGIMDAAKRAGATVYHVSDWKFYPAKLSAGSLMNDWPVFRDAVDCDCFINVPVAKHHGLTDLTLSMKNLMGVCGGMRGFMHQQIDRKLAEITKFIKPDLTVIDAYRVLLRNGPTGGNLSDVETKKTVIASNDPVLADSYAAKLMGRNPDSLGFIREGVAMGIGSMDISRARIKEITV